METKEFCECGGKLAHWTVFGDGRCAATDCLKCRKGTLYDPNGEVVSDRLIWLKAWEKAINGERGVENGKSI